MDNAPSLKLSRHRYGDGNNIVWVRYNTGSGKVHVHLPMTERYRVQLKECVKEWRNHECMNGGEWENGLISPTYMCMFP
jgi:hypothetical protein